MTRRSEKRAPAKFLSSCAHYWSFRNFGRKYDVETDGDVITAFDQRGTDDLVQATEANKPDRAAISTALAGKPAATFGAGGATTFLRNATLGAPVAQPCTVWAVCSRSSAIATNPIMGSITNRWFVRFDGGASLSIFAGTAAATGALVTTTGVRYAVIAVLNGASSKIRVNGTTIYAGATSIGANGVTDFILGTETGDRFEGDIAEAGVCSGDLIANAAELASLETWFERRY